MELLDEKEAFSPGSQNERPRAHGPLSAEKIKLVVKHYKVCPKRSLLFIIAPTSAPLFYLIL